jgi:hypothetical protein
MKCKNGKIQAAGDSYAKAEPQVWKCLVEEEEVNIIWQLMTSVTKI